jgi:sulfur carrier protein ThiS
MPITIIFRKEHFLLDGTIMVKEALQKMGLSPESHLVVRDGQLLNDNDVLRNGEVVKIISAISGG